MLRFKSFLSNSTTQKSKKKIRSHSQGMLDEGTFEISDIVRV